MLHNGYQTGKLLIGVMYAGFTVAPLNLLAQGAHDAEALCVMGKTFASEEIFKVCQHAVELHGGNGIMLEFCIEKLLRDASLFLHRDATVDISRFKIVKAMFRDTAGVYAGPE